MKKWIISGAFVAIVAASTIFGQQVSSKRYGITVKQVTAVDTLQFTALQVTGEGPRIDKAPGGTVFLVVDLTVQMLDPTLKGSFSQTYPQGQSILGMAKVTSQSGEVFAAVGGGFDPQNTCSCEVSVSKAPGGDGLLIVLHPAPPRTVFRNLRPNVLFDGRFVFVIKKEVSTQNVRLQFEDVQLQITAK